jgi:hypothetical protein
MIAMNDNLNDILVSVLKYVVAMYALSIFSVSIIAIV